MPAGAAEHPAAAPATSRAEPRLLRAAPALGAALVVLVFYLVEASLLPAPWDFTDELEWTQLSRAIAATGHAARRGQPVFFKSLYAYLIAPAWWLHSTATAYAAIKDLDAVVMCLAAVPVYLLGRMLLPTRGAFAVAAGSLAIPAMSYATSIIPESLAYFWFALFAWLAVRALARPGLRTALPAALVALLGVLIEKEFVTLPVIALLAAAVLYALRGAAGSSRTRLRRSAAALAVLAVFGYAFNRLVVEHVEQWTASSYLNGRTLAEGGLAAGALAIGLGMLPLIGGIGSLWLPERHAEPAYRAFAALLAASLVVLFLYTAGKVAHLNPTAPLPEERNVFFLSPLLLLGTALCLVARRLDWRLVGAAAALALVVVWSADATEIGAPFFEAPGLAILSLANRDFVWDAQDFRILLCAVSAVSLALLALRRRRGVVLLAALLVGGWMVTGEIYETSSNDLQSRRDAALVPPPRAWLDAATHGAPVTFLGESISDTTRLWETEFWNRSLAHVASTTGGAPGPGPGLAPVLASADGTLTQYTGNPYTLAEVGVSLDAPVVKVFDDYTLYRTTRPWRLLWAEQGVDSTGWAYGYANYTYFKPSGPGRLIIHLSRSAYTGPGTPAAVTVLVGTARVDHADGEPVIARAIATLHRRVADGKLVIVTVHVPRAPVTVVVNVATNTLLHLPGDPRSLGVLPGFRFVPDPPSGTHAPRRGAATAISSRR